MDQCTNFESKTEFIFQCRTRLKKILDRLGWSEEATLKDYNTNSVASSHKEVAKKPKSPNRTTYPESCATKNCLVLETSQLQKLLENNEVNAPRNFIELQANFSRKDKLKIYEHVIANTKKLDNNVVEKEVEGKLSLADILAQKKREEKRKKRRFRKSKPTHIEEVRCLVDIQMQALLQYIDNNEKNNDKSKHSENDTSRNRNRIKSDKQEEKVDNSRKRRRSRSKERDRHKHKRHKRSSSKELSLSRKRHSKSRSGHRGKQSNTSRKDTHYKRKRRGSRSKSTERHNSRRRSKSRSGKVPKENNRRRSRSKERHSRYYNEERTREKSNHRKSRSKERCTQRQDYTKYAGGKDYFAYKTKYNEEYHREKSKKSPEKSSLKYSSDQKYKSK